MMNKPPVGYLLKKASGLEGERGVAYDYVLSSQGVWVEAEGPLFAARVQVAYGEIRGLAPSEFSLALRYGPIPHVLFELALNLFLTDTTREWYAAITREDDGYHIIQPRQTREGARVTYDNPDKVILDLHSHNTMGAGFSGTDNNDEQGLKLYGVVGRLDKEPELALRVGVYGHFYGIEWENVFDGSPTSVRMTLEPDIDEDEESLARADAAFGDIKGLPGFWPGQALISKANTTDLRKKAAGPQSLREELGPNTYIELPAREKTNPKPKPKPWWHWFNGYHQEE